MSLPKIVFMGTPDFAVPCLQALIDADYPIALVVTQPDKPVGRKQVLTPPPVKALALKYDIPVFQPEKLRKDPEVLPRLQAAGADLFVVVAYGKILPQAILDLPAKGCINVHASLLPAYRGSAPIQWSIIKGETETGVTTMLMDAGMDTGDMLLSEKIPIAPDDTGITLAEKLSRLGAEALLKTLPIYLSGELRPTPQNHNLATVIPMLTKEDGRIDWTKSALEIHNLVRGLQPWPETYTVFRGLPLKIKQAQVYGGQLSAEGMPGQVVAVLKQSFLVQTGQGLLEVLRVQLSGSKEMSAGDFSRGQRLETAECFNTAALA